MSHLSDKGSYREKIKNVHFQQSLTIVPDICFVTLLKNKENTPTQAPNSCLTIQKKIQGEAVQAETPESPQPLRWTLIPTSESQ